MTREHIVIKNSKIYGRAALVAAVSSVAIMAASSAYAQDQADTEEMEEFEEIVVTGKFQQSLVDRIPIAPHELPFSLDTIDRDLLDKRNFARPIEALSTLPNVRFFDDRQGTGTPYFFARGYEAPFMVDNRPQAGWRGSGGRDDVFIQSYEVLRGPASISLGAVGAGGVINAVTKVPEAEPFVASKIRADHFGSIATELDINLGNIFGSEVVSARISGAYRNMEFDADFVDRQTFAVRPVFVFDFSEKTSAKISLAYTEHETTPNSGFPLLADGTTPESWSTDTFFGFVNGRAYAEDTYIEAEVIHDFLDNLKLTVRGSNHKSNLLGVDTGAAYNYNYANDVPGMNVNDPYFYLYTYALGGDNEISFVDAQLAYNFDWNGNQQDFVISASYVDSNFKRGATPFPLLGPYPAAEAHLPRLGGNPDLDSFVYDFFGNMKQLSVVFETAIRPNDWLTVVGGLRYDDTEDVTSFPGYDDEIQSVSKLTSRFGLSAEVSASLNVYASFAESYIPQSGVTQEGQPIPPETSVGYEAGLKGSVLEGRLNFTAAIFHTTRQNVGVTRWVVDPETQVGFAFTETIGKVRSKGIELTGRFNPVDGFEIDLSYGLTDTDILEAGQLDEISSTAFPKHTFSGYASYTVQAGPLEGLRIGTGARYTGDRPSIVEGVTFPSYTLVDIGISYPVNDNLEISVDMHNAFDKLYLETTGSITGRLTGSSNFGAPRTMSVTLRSKF